MEPWPALPYLQWGNTKDTLHMFSQILGKTALSHSTRINHWWNCGLQVTERGLKTGTLTQADAPFHIELEFRTPQRVNVLTLETAASFQIQAYQVNEFYKAYKRLLRHVGLNANIWPVPVEIANGIPFKEDNVHTIIDPAYIGNFHRILLSTQRVLEQFRSRFVGKASPVLFWWGTFDICVTLFSGRPAPPRDGADSILREAMSHEEMSFGWWPGDDSAPEPAFYAYVYPEPPGIGDAALPHGAFYSAEKQEFFLPYDIVRNAADPDALLLEFCNAVYTAGASLANWDPALLRS